MKIGTRRFVFPVLLKMQEEKNFCPNLHTIRDDPAFLRALSVRRMGGSARTTTYAFEIKVGSWYRRFSFCWRPDVTRRWWTR